MVYDAKRWLRSYDSDVKTEIEIPDISLKDLFVGTFNDYPSRAAFHYMGMSMTFEELSEKSGRFASGLTEKGLGKGDVMGWMIRIRETDWAVHIAAIGHLNHRHERPGLAWYKLAKGRYVRP